MEAVAVASVDCGNANLGAFLGLGAGELVRLVAGPDFDVKVGVGVGDGVTKFDDDVLVGVGVGTSPTDRRAAVVAPAGVLSSLA